MRFMVLVKANADTEAGVMPTEQELAEMGAFNQRLIDAGVMEAGEGLHPSSRGARVQFAKDGASTVIDGPFAETKELVAGFWVWKVGSRQEAIDWIRQAPFKGAVIEIRQIFAAEDFGAEFTPELREQEDRQREQIANSKENAS
jgi:hypothetical protein